MLGVIVKAGRICKVGVVHAAQFTDLFIHHLHKGISASSHMFGQSVGCLVAGLQKQQIETVAHGQDIALLDIFLVSASRLHIVHGVMGEGDHIVKTAVFYHYQCCQKLCDTGRRRLVMDALTKQHCPGISVNHNSDVSHNSCIAWPFRSGQSCEGR